MNRITNEQREAIVREAVAKRDAILTGKPDLSACEVMVDGEGVSLESNKPFGFTCCDCGLTHRCVIVSEDGKPVGFAIERDQKATTEKRNAGVEDSMAAELDEWRAMVYAPRDGTEVELLVHHPYWQYAKGDNAQWEQIVRAKWIDFNHGGWTWEGMYGHPVGWRPCGVMAAPAAEPCPLGADKPEPTCTNRHQCWEPCGELGKSEEHVRVGRQSTCGVMEAPVPDLDLADANEMDAKHPGWDQPAAGVMEGRNGL